MCVCVHVCASVCVCVYVGMLYIRVYVRAQARLCKLLACVPVHNMSILSHACLPVNTAPTAPVASLRPHSVTRPQKTSNGSTDKESNNNNNNKIKPHSFTAVVLLIVLGCRLTC